MKRKTLKKVLAVVLTGAMVLSLAACGKTPASGGIAAQDKASGNQESQDKEPAPGEDFVIGEISATTPQDVPTITFYPRDANLTSGMVGGYKGEYFAKRGFNLEVWAYSDEKTNAILASGELPDVMIIPVEKLDPMIQSGMLLNLEDYVDKMPPVQAFEELDVALNYVRKFRSNGTGSLYCMPLSVGNKPSLYQVNDVTDRRAVKLQWEAYKRAGYPEITDMNSLLDAAEAMMEAMPAADDGNTMYGTVLNTGSDTTAWACMNSWFQFQGYEPTELAYLLEANMVDGTVSSILSTDSKYYEGLKWYNQAYKRGLLDPDSISNDRATQKPKVDHGYVMVPSGHLPGWATTYMPYLVPGTKVYHSHKSTYGDPNLVIGINAKTENLEACLNFIDMLADADAYLWVRSGPAGEVWDVDDNGVATFTEKGMAHTQEAANGKTDAYKLESGEEMVLWNTPWIVNDGGALTSYTGPDGERRPSVTTAWSEMTEINTNNDTYRSWQQVTGYDTWKEWLEAENAWVMESELTDINLFESMPDDMMKLTIDAIRDKVNTASWKMVYAETDEEFEKLWNQMVSDCEGLGAQEIIDWRLADIENAKKIRDSLK